MNRADGPLYLLEPQTYMNLSGKSVAVLARFFKIAPADMLVVHDEIDLPPGQMKLKLGGGAAGHNGLKDIQAQLGSADFWRLRIGVGHPGNKDEVARLRAVQALGGAAPGDRGVRDRSLDALDLLIDGPMERAMMKIHAKPKAAPRGTRAMSRLPLWIAVARAMRQRPAALAQDRVYRCGPDGRAYSRRAVRRWPRHRALATLAAPSRWRRRDRWRCATRARPMRWNVNACKPKIGRAPGPRVDGPIPEACAAGRRARANGAACGRGEAAIAAATDRTVTLYHAVGSR